MGAVMSGARRIAGRLLRIYYRPGSFYRIPFGPMRGKYVEYDPSVNVDLMLGLHEPNTIEVFRQLVRPGMTVVDIGANRGYFAVFLDHLVGPDGLVYAFEPVPGTFYALKRALDYNESRRVIAVQKAVSWQDGVTTIFLGTSHYMSSMNCDWAGEAGGTVQVPCVQLDSFFESEGGRPDLIKMDIEGGGVLALPGMSCLIQEYGPYLLLESHTPEEDRAIGKALMLADYEVFRVGADAPITNLESDYTDPFGVWGTVLGVPKQHLKQSGTFQPGRFQRPRLGQRPSPVFHAVPPAVHRVQAPEGRS
jgi:FkbM family methyltransferase